MIQLLLEYAIVCLLMVPLGFVTVKLTYWGLAIFAAISGSYLMLNSKDASAVFLEGVDAIIQMWKFGPYLVNDMVSQGIATGDPLAMIIYTLIGFLPVIPYAVGVGLGLLYFPDLWFAGFVYTLLFRIVL